MTLLAVETVDLVVGRGAAPAAGPVSFRLRGGEALVATGPNGAGKSTLMRTLAGLLPPLAGRMGIDGALAADGETAETIAEAAHYVGHRNGLKPGLSVADNLDFWRRYLAGPQRRAAPGGAAAPAASIGQALGAIGLADLGDLAAGYLSAGQQRRVCLARLLVAPRPVWLLDEPTAALDAASQERFAGLMRHHLDAGGIVVAATHQPLGLEGHQRLDLSGAEDRGPAEGDAGTIDEAALAAAEGWL